MDWLKTSAEKGGAFLAEQAPLYAQEVVALEFWSSVVCGVLFLLASALSALVLYALTQAKAKNCDEEGARFACCAAAAVLTLFLLFLGVGPCVYCAVKAKVAPRMVIIEHVRGLSK
jgi:hypothetical protein